MQYYRGLPGLVGTVVGAQWPGVSVGGRGAVEQTGDLLGVDLLTLLYPPRPPRVGRGQPLFLLGVLHLGGIQGCGSGLLTSRGSGPWSRAKDSRNSSLFAFPLLFSQLPRKTCLKNHSQQPCLTPVF